MSTVRPYGDALDDGLVQMSFTLPLPPGEHAAGVALHLAERMGFEKAQIVHMKGMGLEHTFFIVYGRTIHAVDPSMVSVRERDFPELTPPEVNRMIRESLKRRLVVVGACTGTDAHTVGLDAILSMKGYAGDKGLEYFAEMDVRNLGSQVTPEEIVTTVRTERVDAVLISQVVTQRDAHIVHLQEVRDALVEAGERARLILVGGGPRLAPEQATELGYDRIFGRGTKPSDVAAYLAWTASQRSIA